MIPLALVRKRKASGTTLTASAGLIFATDFSSDTGFFTNSSTAGYDPIALSGFDGYNMSSTTGNISVVAEGIGGSNALKLHYPAQTQPTISLAKHLSGNSLTGYDEIFIRYNMMFPSTFRAGDSSLKTDYWKFFRAWQNTELSIANWTENRADSHYIVYNFGGNHPYGPCINAIYGENAGTNIGGTTGEKSRQDLTFYATGQSAISDNSGKPAWFEGLFGQIDRSTLGQEGRLLATPAYHTIEYRLKLATSPTSDNGEVQIFFDGVDQGAYQSITPLGPDTPTRTGIPTARMGSGLNFIGMFDNMVNWNDAWQDGNDHDMRVNDIVISTQRIGHSYIPLGVIDNTGVGAT